MALVEARRGGVRTSRPMDGPAAEVVAVIDSGGAVHKCIEVQYDRPSQYCLYDFSLLKKEND